jgi:hypothetical protein
MFFDQQGAQARFRSGHGRESAGGTGADNDYVVLTVNCSHTLLDRQRLSRAGDHTEITQYAFIVQDFEDLRTEHQGFMGTDGDAQSALGTFFGVQFEFGDAHRSNQLRGTRCPKQDNKTRISLPVLLRGSVANADDLEAIPIEEKQPLLAEPELHVGIL